MAIETVRVYVQDDEVAPGAVDDVVVRVFDSTGTTFITSATTGDVEDGIASLELDGDEEGTRYQLRFFIEGGAIVSPQYIDVFSPVDESPTGTNNFSITATLYTAPVATDPRLCRCSGYVRGPNGRYRGGVDIHFIPLQSPVIVGTAALLGERSTVRTDRNGYAEIDLFRGGYYHAVVESHENEPREVAVPDRSSVNLADLLFPVVRSATFAEDAPYAIEVDEELELTPTIICSDFRELEGTASDDVTYSVDDTSIASVSVLSDRIVVKGISSGTTTLRIARSDTSIVLLPDPGIEGAETTIVVT